MTLTFFLRNFSIRCSQNTDNFQNCLNSSFLAIKLGTDFYTLIRSCFTFTLYVLRSKQNDNITRQNCTFILQILSIVSVERDNWLSSEKDSLKILQFCQRIIFNLVTMQQHNIIMGCTHLEVFFLIISSEYIQLPSKLGFVIIRRTDKIEECFYYLFYYLNVNILYRKAIFFVLLFLAKSLATSLTRYENLHNGDFVLLKFMIIQMMILFN